MNSLEIRKVSDETDLQRLRRFMLLQPQFYPGHGEWVEGKAIPRIESDQAEGLLVIQDGVVVGDAVYQKVSDPSAIELKNFRIDPGYKNRSIGHCLLRQVEVEGAALSRVESGGLTIIADVSTPNFNGVEFFIRNGFKITGMEELYLPGQAEYTLQKVV